MNERPRILAVDDDPAVRVLLTRVLNRAGYDVHAVETGEEAVDYLQANPVALLIVDKNLPRMHGLEVIRRGKELAPDVPVLLITAAPEPQLAAQVKVEVYLPKPFASIKAIEDAVKEAIARGKANQERQQMQRKLEEVMSQLRRPEAKKPI
ncbi:MAG: response regulator [Myxococcales bacterium]|nr:response regulator [Myxococcales bacterium]